jgi:predicted nucleic acid-binding Zn ribbon protein
MRVRRAPRRLDAALGHVRGRAEPRTLLAAVQTAWPSVAGAGVTVEAEPVAERDGVVTIACRSATWAQELDLLQTELLERLNFRLADPHSGAFAGPVKRLRFTADAPRHTN